MTVGAGYGGFNEEDLRQIEHGLRSIGKPASKGHVRRNLQHLVASRLGLPMQRSPDRRMTDTPKKRVPKRVRMR